MIHTFEQRDDKMLIRNIELQDLVQIVTNDFKTELREENHWLLFAPIPVATVGLDSSSALASGSVSALVSVSALWRQAMLVLWCQCQRFGVRNSALAAE